MYHNIKTEVGIELAQERVNSVCHKIAKEFWGKDTAECFWTGSTPGQFVNLENLTVPDGFILYQSFDDESYPDIVRVYAKVKV